MNRLDRVFSELRAAKQNAFIAYITAGDPDLRITLGIMERFAKNGVDVLELGVPFSDPIGDGPVNQAAAERAIASGTDLQGIFDIIAEFRKRHDTPIVLFSYLNPLRYFGYENFAAEAARCGVDALLAVDGPYDMCGDLEKTMRRKGLHMIFLAAPTTPTARMRAITRHSGGFIYCISSLGVTGVRKKIGRGFLEQVRALKQVTTLPVCVGFGIGDPQTARAVARVADGVIVGSGFVERIGRHGKNTDRLYREIDQYTRIMLKAVKLARGPNHRKQGIPA